MVQKSRDVFAISRLLLKEVLRVLLHFRHQNAIYYMDYTI